MARYCRIRISGNRCSGGDMARLNVREKGARCVGTAMVMNGEEGEREREEERMRVDEQARARELALKGLGSGGRC